MACASVVFLTVQSERQPALQFWTWWWCFTLLQCKCLL